MKSVYLINGGMDADAFGILCRTCERELARRGVGTGARDEYGIRVAVDATLASRGEPRALRGLIEKKATDQTVRCFFVQAFPFSAASCRNNSASECTAPLMERDEVLLIRS